MVRLPYLRAPAKFLITSFVELDRTLRRTVPCGLTAFFDGTGCRHASGRTLSKFSYKRYMIVIDDIFEMFYLKKHLYFIDILS
jgi:hypothetical protein